jgi:peptidoglycan/xylan/chitin deacetylase (PgdA/CDA1 family)
MRRELILNFHGIGTPHNGVDPDEIPFWIPRRKFLALIDQVACMSDAPGAQTIITFDDGNASDATIAMPELTKRGLTATFFVCADRIGAPRYLDRGAIAEMLQTGMSIGTHGMRHCDWRALDDTALNAEIGEARERIADVCGRPVREASIPLGSYDRGACSPDCGRKTSNASTRATADWHAPTPGLPRESLTPPGPVGYRARCRRVPRPRLRRVRQCCARPCAKVGEAEIGELRPPARSRRGGRVSLADLTHRVRRSA